MTGSQGVGANLLGHNQQLIKLQVIVAKAARNGRASRKILLDERTHHVALEALLVIDHVIRDADGLGDAARVVHVVERAAASLHRLGHALVPGQPALVPELHGQADDIVPSARSMAATVEESTPPDMATAMVLGLVIRIQLLTAQLLASSYWPSPRLRS